MFCCRSWTSDWEDWQQKLSWSFPWLAFPVFFSSHASCSSGSFFFLSLYGALKRADGVLRCLFADTTVVVYDISLSCPYLSGSVSSADFPLFQDIYIQISSLAFKIFLSTSPSSCPFVTSNTCIFFGVNSASLAQTASVYPQPCVSASLQAPYGIIPFGWSKNPILLKIISGDPSSLICLLYLCRGRRAIYTGI